ncbi:MAG: serine hydrolase domain-containing protein [Terriglobia bacterium]|jgi:CubicO group peptidase (beta-lactamase class C family)
MRNSHLLRFALSLLAGLLLVAGAHRIQAQQANSKTPQLAGNKPEALGFSSERLERLHAVMQQEVDQKQLAGIVTILARHGKVVEERTYGKKDLASGAPMTRDTIFRIFSMTKPVTGVAMMILYEQGKWYPLDPVSKYIPEFAHLKVFKGVDQSGNMIVEDPVHPPTMHELMTHTAGFTYGFFGNTLVDKMYLDQHVWQSQSLQEMIDKLAKIPLLYQPGTRWVYGASMDIQGYIVEKLSGQSLPDFMQQQIFGPLGMKDTGFFVPPEKRNRFATLYREDQKGELAADVTAGGVPTDYATRPPMPSGGGGMVSTAQDYLRFAQMLLNGGELDGVRILAPITVELMTTNHLAPSLMTGEFSIGPAIIRPGMGWGYDCAVYTDPLEADEVVGKGTFFWSGAADTWFWVDPTNDLILVGMTQRMLGPGWPNVQALSRPPVYQALLKPRM